MATNLVEYLAQLKAKDPKRANWIMDCPDVGTNDFGFYKVKKCVEVIAGTNVRYDFKSAYSTNPTICPVLSRAKAEVVAIWIPIRLYVPAFRDGEPVKAGKCDYSFPTINFDYRAISAEYYNADKNTPEGAQMFFNGAGLPYIPANSIYSELGMWMPYYQPIGFAHRVAERAYPEAKNAIPLLGYIDFYRNYVINTQNDKAIPIRVQGYARQYVYSNGNPNSDGAGWITREPKDWYVTRSTFDELFSNVRRVGANYFEGDGNFDITPFIAAFYQGHIAPRKYVISDPVTDYEHGVFFNDNHYGELRATYLPDYYTAYLSNENVDYERSTARVQVDDEGYITMEQIYAAERVQKFIRGSIFRNSDYAEFVDVQYGVKPSTELTKPMFLGAVSTWLSFNDIVAQAQTSEGNSDIASNTDLGSRASLGFGRMVTGKLRDKDERYFVNFTAREPGYFMVLECIIPEVTYWQGFNPMYDKRSLQSIYFPSFDRDGYQDKQAKYLVEQVVRDVNTLPASAFFDEYNIAYAQEPAWWEYMSTYGRLSGQMVEPGVYRHWTFRREIMPHSAATTGWPDQSPPIMGGGIGYADFYRQLKNTYVVPEHFNDIFANVNGLDNIQTYYRHELKLYQPLSHRFQSF